MRQSFMQRVDLVELVPSISRSVQHILSNFYCVEWRNPKSDYSLFVFVKENKLTKESVTFVSNYAFKYAGVTLAKPWHLGTLLLGLQGDYYVNNQESTSIMYLGCWASSIHHGAFDYEDPWVDISRSQYGCCLIIDSLRIEALDRDNSSLTFQRCEEQQPS